MTAYRPDVLAVLGPHHPLNDRVTGWLTNYHDYATFMFRAPAATMVEALVKHTKDKTEKRSPSWFANNLEGLSTPIPKLSDYTAQEIAQAVEFGLLENLDPDFIVKAMALRINSFLASRHSAHRPILFLDTRAQNEIDLVKALGGKFLRIKMPSLPPIPPLFDGITPDFIVDVPDIERFEEIHDMMFEMFPYEEKK